MEPAPELLDMAARISQAGNDNSSQVLYDIISKDENTIFLGTAGDEYWQGYEAIIAGLRMQHRELDEEGAMPTDFQVLSLVALKEVSVGWVIGRVSFRANDKTIVARTTSIFHLEGAYWRLVHSHSSLDASNVENFGVELTTKVDDLLVSAQAEFDAIHSRLGDREVSIVFTDIENSTVTMEAMGDARWLALLAWHEEQVRQQVSVFGGTVVKNQGDGFMLAFPAVGAALACTIAIQRAVSVGFESTPVAVRVGVHVGDATANSGDFFGRTVVVAARVANAASGGEILVTADVHDQLADAFTFGAPRTVALKGLSEAPLLYPVSWH